LRITRFISNLSSCFFALCSDFGPAKKMNENVKQQMDVMQKARGLLKNNIFAILFFASIKKV
jgi:hypothetical protein